MTLAFTFDGRSYQGEPGDTLAAALLRNGVRVVGRSVDLGRPRGVFSAGPEEPNALVRVGATPMVAATLVELYDGLAAWSLRGKGRIDLDATDDRRCDKGYLHADVLVIGAGPAGLSAALSAAERGGRVILLDDQPEVGGDLLNARAEAAWAAAMGERLAAFPEVRILTRTTALGYYDHTYVTAVQRGRREEADRFDERLWHIRARQVILATGAQERSVAFPGNDRPGVMLASAARAYANRYGVLPGRRAVVFTLTDSGHEAARDLAAAGVDVVAVVDPRLDGRTVTGTTADDEGVLTGVHIGADYHEADLLAVAGGWNPVVHLFSQAQGKLRFDENLQTYLPAEAPRQVSTVGACRGVYTTAGAIADGRGETPQERLTPPARLWLCGDDPATSFADLHRDVTVADVARAVGTGMRSAEHVKRYTTAGTGADQGRTSVVAGVMATLLGSPPGLTTFRPPYGPVSFATLAGRDRGALSDPARTTAMHGAHLAGGAVFEDVGQWKRPRYFPQEGEDMAAAVRRECAAARSGVAAMDASTLGKIDIRGADAGSSSTGSTRTCTPRWPSDRAGTA